MSALSSPLGSGPEGAVLEVPEEVLARRRSLVRGLPVKAKVGAVILGVFILIAVIGP